MPEPIYMAALVAYADHFTVTWIQDGLTEINEAPDLMAALDILKERMWPNNL